MINVPNINQSAINNSGTITPQTQQVPANISQQNNTTQNYTATIYPQETVSVYNPAENGPKLTHTSWFYINDVHGKMTNMERIYNISKEFDSTPSNVMASKFFSEGDSVSKFKVSSGDVILGEEIIPNTVANQFLNWSGFMASALGNHELDITKPENFAKFLSESNYKMLAANVDIDPNSPLANKIHKSMITENDGVRYGIIGIAPPDMHQRVKQNDTLKDFKIYNVDETIKRVLAEAKRLKEEEGIKHIVVLSHGGNKLDKQLAQESQDIDIIFGAHTHNLIKGITEGENLFYSKTGEPVIITQAGKDGETLGILNVSFDENGVIKKAQNNIIKTREYNRPLFIKDTVENILGKPEIVGRVRATIPPPENRLTENNPHGNLITDAMRIQLGTDMALLNAGNIRGYFSQGPIDTRLLTDISPFGNKMMILELTEKQIVDAIKHGLNSTTKPSNKPGLLLVSGLRYTGTKQGELLELEFIDKNNQVHKIDINNPRTDKKYTVAADDFFATGGDGYLESNKNPNFVLQKFDVDKNVLAADYIKKLDQPIDITDDKRIQII